VNVRMFRWKAVGPLLLFGLGFAMVWWLCADRIARKTGENVGTRVLGARVDIRHLHLDPLGGKIELRGLTVASPQEPLRNLLEADELLADVDLLPLQTEAIELLPFDSVMSEITRIVYGNLSSGGRIDSIDRSARQPCPISRRPGPRMGRTSPTEYDGK